MGKAIGIFAAIVLVVWLANWIEYLVDLLRERRRNKRVHRLIQDIRTHVCNKRRINDDELTEMINEYLRARYQLPPLANWWEGSEVELTKILTQYGGRIGM